MFLPRLTPDSHTPEYPQRPLKSRIHPLEILILLLVFGFSFPATAQKGQEKIEQQILELEKAVGELRNAGVSVRAFDQAIKEARKLLKRGKGQSALSLIQKTVQEVNKEDQNALGTLSTRGKKVLPGVDPKKIFPRIEGSMTRPVYSVTSAPVSRTQLENEEPMIAIRVENSFRSYPSRLVTRYRLVPDKVGGRSIFLLADPYADSMVAFGRNVAGRTLTFSLFGVYNAGLLIRDQQTGTLWSAVTGEALIGPMVGRKLTPVPTLRATWENWKELRPKSTTVGISSKIQKLLEKKQRQRRRLNDPARTVVRNDTRLKADRIGFGIALDDERRFYPLIELDRGVVVERVGKRPVAIFRPPGGSFALAYEVRLGKRILVFDRERTDTFQVKDRSTGSFWDLLGYCFRGPLRGAQLKPIGGVVVSWESWSAAGDTTLYQPEE
ncbi:MAG: DUF3179 domain-containing (seleno)protein [Planctomycetota bacterium]|jgi:hypothetical protein|nr:DUF3179 domain-containing (seleno)protein [Planctomycetota bacterium]